VKELAYSVLFLRSLPLSLMREDFGTEALELSVKDTDVSVISDENNENFMRQLIFRGGDVQYWADYFLSRLERVHKVRPEDVVWAYEAYVEVDERVKLDLRIPSVFPLVGNVINYGIVISNDPDMKMRVRNFTTLQLDKTIKVIKRSEKYFKIQNILDELEKVIKFFT
jgi:hypothetical protein